MRKHPLKSRKLWLAVIGTVVLLINQVFGLELDPEEIIALLSPLIAYILGESLIDAKK